ncbi:hypothetical protein Y032_0074g878 [Ancylostoma ceylanicum]|nr:hypothetical protein Y032_0074g878 [Ancylostoma ceylanicum]
MGAYFVQYGYRRYKWSKQKNPGVYGILIQEEPKLPRFNPFVFLPPAICDIIGTSVMYIGLNLTTASSYQMLRGALIVCTGLLSIFMVAAKIPGFKWMGMLLVVMGLVVVGVTDILCGDHVEHSKQDIIVGDVLCVVAQVFVALQLVLEQKYMAKYDVEPLFAVGLEGIYGLVLLIIALVPLYYIHVPPVFSTNPEGRLEDLFYAWKQINMEPMIAVALSGTTISIAFFNYAGVSVTKELSATTRTVIDSIRTIVIWAASIPLFHAKFIPYQIIGFVLLLMGMFIYNDIVLGPWIRFKFLPEKEPESRDCSWCCFKFWGMHLLQEEEEEAEIEDAIEMKRRRATTVLSGEVEVEQRM